MPALLERPLDLAYPDAVAGTKYLDIEGVAEFMGWTVESTRTLHKRAARRRRDGDVRPGDLPAPDEVFGGRTPVWLVETLESFKVNRPGKGAGGGRPWHKAPSR